MEDQTLNSAITKEARPENLRSGSNSILDVFLLKGEPQGDATFHSESENVNQNQSLPVTSNIPDESSREQKGGHSETNYDATHVFESREGKNKPETHPRLGLSKSNSKHSPEDALRAAIQGNFDQMSKFVERRRKHLMIANIKTLLKVLVNHCARLSGIYYQ